MRVVVFCHNFPRTHDQAIVSGVIKNAYNQALAVAQAGASVTVLTSGTTRGNWQCEGVEVHSVGRSPGKGILKAAIDDVKLTIKFILLRRKFSIAHVHTGNLVVLFMLKRLHLIRLPIVYTAHGTTTPELQAHYEAKPTLFERLVRLNGHLQERIDRFMWQSADRLVSVSQFQNAEMQKIYGVPATKLIQFYNGVDERYYHPVTANEQVSIRQSLNLPPHAPVLLFVGRMVKKKGIDTLLEALPHIQSRVPTAHLVIVGGDLGGGFDRPYVSALMKRVQPLVEMGSVSFAANATEAELPYYYQAADVCIFPSREYESLPTVIFEAMATGLPIITTKAWGSPEVLPEVLIEESALNDRTLANAVTTLLEDRAAREAQGSRNRSLAADFYWSKIGVEYYNFYDTLCHG